MAYPDDAISITALPAGQALATAHVPVHAQLKVAADALGTKLGAGSSTPTLGKQLRGTGTGTSAWGGLTEVVIRATGGNDSTQINAAIQAATGPTRLIFPDAAYLIGAQVVVDKDNIFFVGASAATNPASTGRTTFTASAAWSGPMLLWYRAGGTGGSYNVSGGGLSDIYVYGAGIADDGIGIKTARHLSFHDFAIQSCLGAGLTLTTRDTGGAYDDVTNCRFDSFQIILDNGVGIQTEGLRRGVYGCSFTRFSVSVVGTSGGIGLDITGVDDLWFDQYAVYAAAGSINVRMVGGDYNGGQSPSAASIFGKGYFNGASVIEIIGDGFDNTPRENLFLGLSTIDVATEWRADVGTAPSYLDTAGRHNLRQHGKTTALVQDDFMAGNLASGTIGEAGWSLPTGTLAYIAGQSNHPGVVRLSTGASINTTANLVLRPSTTVGLVSPGDAFDMEFVVALHTVDLDTNVRFGLAGDYSGGEFGPNEGIFFYKRGQAGHTTWHVGCVTGGIGTGSSDLAAPVVDTFQRFRIWRLNDGTICFKIGDTVNQVRDYSISTNVPTVPLTPFVQIFNATAADKSVDIDWFQLHITGMSR